MLHCIHRTSSQKILQKSLFPIFIQNTKALPENNERIMQELFKAQKPCFDKNLESQ